MYAFTVGCAQAFRETLKIPTTWRRIYRWEDKWGILTGDAWNAEIREAVVFEGEKYLLETIHPQPIHAPPPSVDDIWEEEVHILPYGTCGNVLTIRGTLSEIKHICSSNKIAIPSTILAYIDANISTPSEPRKEDVVLRTPPRGGERSGGMRGGGGGMRGGGGPRAQPRGCAY